MAVDRNRIVVVGSGALAGSLCDGLAVAPLPVAVTVVARNGTAAEHVATAARVRAAIVGSPATFRAETGTDLAAIVGALRPAVLVCCASAQSPYERVTAPSAWTDLVARAGFGITVPFQAHLAVPLARAVASASPDTTFVNGALPDLVNPLLSALGLPVAFGVGNVATLAACLQADLGLADQKALALLGHHVHLAPPDDDTDEVRVWHDGVERADVTARLAAARALPRRTLNAIAGHATARLLVDLLDRREVRTSVPGPLGLPGGYPVRIDRDAVTLDLPPGLTRDDAVEWNLRAGRADGVVVRDGRVEPTPTARAALAEHLPDLGAGWPVEALPEVERRLGALRDRLRTVPPAPATAATAPAAAGPPV